MGLHQRYPHVSENPYSPNPPYRQPPLTFSPLPFNSNTTTGELIPEWHSIYPSGISVYAPSGYLSFIITANDTTQPEKRPTTVSLPAQPDDPVEVWATVAQNSLAAGGPFEVLNATDGNGNATYGNSTDGPFGTARSEFETATLPAWVGFSLDNEFAFHDDCNTHVLYSRFSADTLQTVWFYRKPDNSP